MNTESAGILDYPVSRSATPHGSGSITLSVDWHTRDVASLVNSEPPASFFRSFVENLPQCVFCKDLMGRFVFVNQSFCNLLQRPRHQVIGCTDFDLFPASLAAKYREDDEHVRHTLQPLETVEAHQLPDHEKIYVHVLKTPARDASGRVVGVQGIFWDVTEHQQRESTLQWEHDLLNALLDHVPDMIYFKDAESRFVKCSHSVAARLGLKNVSEVVGKTDFDFFTPEHAHESKQDEEEVMRTGQPMVAKAEKEIWKDGREVWLLTTKVPLRNKLGIVIGTFGISKEITELKRVEAELARSRDAALESSRLKGEFLANMSHELRTPMNAVIGMTGFLLESSLAPEQRDFAETIRASASALLEIISDILDFSKIEAGKLALESVHFDLLEVVESAVDLVAHKAHAQKLDLVLRLQPDVPRWLRGDPNRTRQALLNLLSNAIKFTETGEVLVEITAGEQTAAQATIQFTVTDTGIGVPAEAQARIFDSFTQADGSATRQYGGTGLGLAICQRLVQLMQGKIGFESELGEGSTFWFTLPLDKQPDPPCETAPSRAFVDERALVVCDHVSTRSMLFDFLSALGMRVDAALDTSEAMRLAASAAESGQPYAVTFIEHQMPLIDGLSLAQVFHQDPDFHPTQVVLLASPSLSLKLASVPCPEIATCLPKPLKPSCVIKCLNEVLKRAAPPVDAAVANTTHPPACPKITVPLRILLAEDNPVNRKVALRQLRQLGLSADAAENGLEAVKRLASQSYDILLLDCQMPFMDGYQVAQHVRQQEQAIKAHADHAAQPLHIVAMTANALAGDREKCLAAGMDDYLAKPAKITDLHAALERGIIRLGLDQSAAA